MGPTDVGPNPLAIAGYLTQNSLSYQEANDLLSWAEQALQEEAASSSAMENERDMTLSIEGCQEQTSAQVQEIKAFITDTAALNGVGTIVGYVTASVLKKKRKNLNCCKVINSDEEDVPDGWGEDLEDAGPPMDIDLNYRGPSQM
ncbi:hypothetical protein V8B97DRAFT_2010133 [Scleroderma yunnanense]